MNTKQEFSTFDLNLAAVLVTKKQTLKFLDRDQKGKAQFFFIQTDELDQIIQKYWRQELLVNPQDLFNSLKYLKNRIYSSY